MKGAILVLAVLSSGCASYSRAVDTIGGIAKATAASVDILKGPGEDVAEVWSTVFPADAPVEPAK